MSELRVSSDNVSLSEVSSRTVNVAICGNPNCGKTTIFNAITGLRQQVGNYPGVTVERVSGQYRIEGDSERSYLLNDIPGSYSLAAFSPDEYIAARALFGGIAGEPGPDVIVCVIDAVSLERGLYLTLQVMQIGKPVVIALNMIDLAKKRGLSIDTARLSERLGGISVIPVVASRREGIEELKTAISKTAADEAASTFNPYHPEVNEAVGNLIGASTNGHRKRAEYIRILFDQSGPAERAFVREQGSRIKPVLEECRGKLIKRFGSLSAAETTSLIENSSAIFSVVVTKEKERARSTSDRIDSVILHPYLGPVILIVLMTLMFQSIFSWAEPLMHVIDHVFGSLAALVAGMMPDGPLRSLLTDGIIGGVGSVLMFLPQIVILFVFLAILEDSGYLPRMAFLVDRAFGWCGLSGRSFIPLLSSFACAVPGIMATRTIEDRRQRLVTILVAPLMTCSARLPVYAIMIAAFIPQVRVLGLFNSQGLVLGALYLLGLLVAVLVSLLLKRVFHRAHRGTFMMEMPSYKLPTARSIGIRVVNRVRSFVLRAGTVILAITIIIWALSYYPRSNAVTPGTSSKLAVQEMQTSGSSTANPNASVEAAREQAGAQLRNSYFGRLGRILGPAFEPLGWDWRVTMAVLASFPAREVVISTLGTIYNLGSVSEDGTRSLVDKMRGAKWEGGALVGQSVFNPAVALSIMVFFALCCQCGATVVTIRHETGAWKYALWTFAYMTALAYVGALVVYQVAIRLIA